MRNKVDSTIHIQDEWIWRMDYLKKRRLAPAVPDFWERSKKAYLNYKKEKDAEIELINFIEQFNKDWSEVLNK